MRRDLLAFHGHLRPAKGESPVEGPWRLAGPGQEIQQKGVSGAQSWGQGGEFQGRGVPRLPQRKGNWKRIEFFRVSNLGQRRKTKIVF